MTASAEGAADPGEQTERQETPSPLLGLRVLVVEDDADSREALTAVLKRNGAKVAAAASAADALLALDREVPAVLVSDIGLPGGDGYELIREIRKRPPALGGRVPALALTAYVSTEDQARTARAGFQGYLAKPTDLKELVAMVARIAGRRRRSSH